MATTAPDREVIPVQERLDALEMKLDAVAERVEFLVATLERFLPLIERYERASNANSMFGARRAMKGKD